MHSWTDTTEQWPREVIEYENGTVIHGVLPADHPMSTGEARAGAVASSCEYSVYQRTPFRDSVLPGSPITAEGTFTLGSGCETSQAYLQLLGQRWVAADGC